MKIERTLSHPSRKTWISEKINMDINVNITSITAQIKTKVPRLYVIRTSILSFGPKLCEILKTSKNLKQVNMTIIESKKSNLKLF